MAHYAFLDDSNIVTEVIVGRDEDEIVDGISDWEVYYGEFRGQRCLRTSYNGNIRKNFAGIDYLYDEVRDAFIEPQPFPSWIFDVDTCRYFPPVPYPDDGNLHDWDEDSSSWVQIRSGH